MLPCSGAAYQRYTYSEHSLRHRQGAVVTGHLATCTACIEHLSVGCPLVSAYNSNQVSRLLSAIGAIAAVIVIIIAN